MPSQGFPKFLKIGICTRRNYYNKAITKDKKDTGTKRFTTCISRRPPYISVSFNTSHTS